MVISIIFFIVLVAMGILLMHDIARTARCPECGHCRAEIVRQKHDKRIARAEELHGTYHWWAMTSARDCIDPMCEGRS